MLKKTNQRDISVIFEMNKNVNLNWAHKNSRKLEKLSKGEKKLQKLTATEQILGPNFSKSQLPPETM